MPTSQHDDRLILLRHLLDRRSHQLLGEAAPGADELSVIFDAALCAPDYCQLHPSRFIVIDRKNLPGLGDLFVHAAALRDPGKNPEPWRAKFLAAPMMIVLVAKLDVRHNKVSVEEQLLSVGASGMNILNALHLLGYGAYWATGINATDDVVRASLGVGFEERIAGFIFVGTPRDDAKVKRRPISETFVPLFDVREQAALAWAETVTNVVAKHVPDEAYAAAGEVFEEKDLADLTIAIALMKAYNRLGITFRLKPAAQA